MRKPGKIQIEDGTYLYWCPKCKKYLSKDNFCSSKNNKFRDGLNGYCKKCQQERELIYRTTLDPEAGLQFKLKHCLYSARSRAKQMNIEFNLTYQYIKYLYDLQKGLCAVSGIPMTCEYGVGPSDTNVSVDKIDPKKGYVIGNIQLVCWAVNRMKGAMTLEQLIFFCQNVINFQNKQKQLKN